jgi:hypothetical protein
MSAWIRVELPGIRAIWSVLLLFARLFLAVSPVDELVTGLEDERVRCADSSTPATSPPPPEFLPDRYPPAVPTTNAATGKIQGFFMI